jgi:biopolymer transport protein ExbD
MAEKQRFMDVWIVEGESVYKEVPFTVVIDWIQQGRLLEDDQVRPSGTKEWHAVVDTPGLVPYLPVIEPLQAQDMAEALEAVELEVHWKRTHHEEDEEVDMIPLIDVSMVLLVFFMITAASGEGVGRLIKTPLADHAPIANTSGVWVGVDLEGEGKNRTVYYSLGEEGKPSPDPADRHLATRAELLTRLDALLKTKTAPVDLTINANTDCEDGLILDLTVELSKEPRRKKISAKFTGVTERVK